MYADSLEARLSVRAASPEPDTASLDDRIQVEAEAEDEEEEHEQEDATTAATGGEENSLLNRLWSTKVVEFPRGLVQPARVPVASFDSGRPVTGGMYADALDPPPATTSYEEALDPEAEDELATRLQGREDTKRRLLRQGDDTALRTTALFVTSKEIANLNTGTILATVGHAFNRAHRLASSSRKRVKLIEPLALEWVDDESIVLLFDSEDSTLEAFYELTTRELDPERPLDWHEILTLPEDEIEPFYVRAALASDVKAKDAARKSKYYANERKYRGGSSGDKRWRGAKPYDPDDHYRVGGRKQPNWRGHAGRDAFEDYLEKKKRGDLPKYADTDDLDAELDAYRRAGEGGDETIPDQVDDSRQPGGAE